MNRITLSLLQILTADGLIFMTLFVLIQLGCSSNFEANKKELLPSDYLLDGSISYLEVNDTIQLVNYYSDENLIIREDLNKFYVGVRSNRKTILNAYYFAKDKIKIMHCSGALGETNFNRLNEKWIKDRSNWDWRYRDTVIWGRYHKKDYMHENPIQDFDTYYHTFGWVASTKSFGSDREMELIISKEIVQDISNLLISYDLLTINGSKVITGPGKDKGITENDSLNSLIHEGALPLLPDTLPDYFFNIN